MHSPTSMHAKKNPTQRSTRRGLRDVFVVSFAIENFLPNSSREVNALRGNVTPSVPPASSIRLPHFPTARARQDAGGTFRHRQQTLCIGNVRACARQRKSM
jgi:hypothetical protein